MPPETRIPSSPKSGKGRGFLADTNYECVQHALAFLPHMVMSIGNGDHCCADVCPKPDEEIIAGQSRCPCRLARLDGRRPVEQNRLEIRGERIDMDILRRLELSLATGLPDEFPVGGLIGGSGELRFVDERFNQNRAKAVTLGPVIGEPADRHRQHLGRQAANGNHGVLSGVFVDLVDEGIDIALRVGNLLQGRAGGLEPCTLRDVVFDGCPRVSPVYPGPVR